MYDATGFLPMTLTTVFIFIVTVIVLYAIHREYHNDVKSYRRGARFIAYGFATTVCGVFVFFNWMFS